MTWMSIVSIIIQFTACWLWYWLGGDIRRKELMPKIDGLSKDKEYLDKIINIQEQTIIQLHKNYSQLEKQLKPPTVEDYKTKLFSLLS